MIDFIMGLFTTATAEETESVDVLGILNSIFGVVRSLMGLDKERYVL